MLPARILNHSLIKQTVLSDLYTRHSLLTGNTNMNKTLKNLVSLMGENRHEEMVIKQWARQRENCGSTKRHHKCLLTD